MKNDNTSLLEQAKNTADHATKKVKTLAAKAKTRLDAKSREKELTKLFAALGELTFKELQNEPRADKKREELIAKIAAIQVGDTDSP